MSRSCSSEDQAAVVARVQADGGLIENIEHAAKLRADLRRQANALRFAAGKRRRRAVEAQVAEADSEQEIEPRGNFRQRAPGDVNLAFGEAFSYFIDCGTRVGNREGGELRNRTGPHFHGEAFRAQPAFVAHRAGHRRHVLRDPLAIVVRTRFLKVGFQKTDYALEMQSGGALAALVRFFAPPLPFSLAFEGGLP